MELKRYVLTDRNNIVDLSKGCIYANGHVGKFILKDDIVYNQYDDSYDLQTYCKIKNTSDNILDLVDVGDLLEKDNDWEILKVMKIRRGDAVCIIRTSSNIEEYEVKDYRKSSILAIYKRQTNGDYKRYEIGGKE